MVAGGLLLGVGDGEESGFAVQPAGEGDRARAGPAGDVAEAAGKYHGRVAGQVGDDKVRPGADVKIHGLHQPGHRPHQKRTHPRCAQVLDGRTNCPWRNVSGQLLRPSVTWFRVSSSKTAAASVPTGTPVPRPYRAAGVRV